jgi:hypothetical protein
LGFNMLLPYPWGVCGSPNCIQEDLQTETRLAP